MSLYVALDGPDGCGKSSQAAALAAFLQERGTDVLHVREPGSTPVGESLRELLLAKKTGELRAITEVLLFSAARAELVDRVIAPALARGQTVIAERCFLSTSVYQVLATQTEGSAMSLSWFEDLTRRVHGAVLPDQIFVLDVTAEVSAQRREQRVEDRIEARGDDYQRRVREGFLATAAREPRAVVLDAGQAFDDVQAALREHLLRRMS